MNLQSRMPFRSAADLQIVLKHVSERSVLDRELAAGLQARFVDGRSRLATCSGVAWFDGHHLAVVNLFGGTLRIYRFHSSAPARLQLLHEVEIPHPAGVAVSPNGRLLAVAHAAIGGGGLSLLQIDPRDHAPRGQGETIRQAAAGTQFHGVSFSRDSRHLAFTEMGFPGYVEVVRLEGAARLTTCMVRNHRPHVTVKSVAFTPDGRFVALALAPTSQSKAEGAQPPGALAVYRYDADRGVIADEPIAELTIGGAELRNLETCVFLPTAVGGVNRILASNQGDDIVSAFAFDPQDGTLRSEGVFADNLAFPHGVDVSADGRFVAIATYGDDSLHIARLSPVGVLGRGRQAIARALAALTA